MTILFTALLLSLFSAQSFAATPSLRCKAIYRTLDEKNNTVERSTSLTPRPIAGEVKHEADFEGKFFTLTEEAGSGDLFAQITGPSSAFGGTAPDYLRGSVVRGAADSQGRFTATEVVGYTIYRLECERNR